MKAALALAALLFASVAHAESREEVLKNYTAKLEARGESLKKELRMKMTPAQKNQKLAQQKQIKDTLAALEKGKIVAPTFDTVANDKDISRAYEPQVGHVFTATDADVGVVRGKNVELVYHVRYLANAGGGRAVEKVEREIVNAICKGPFERGKVYYISSVDDNGTPTIEQLE
jgi:excinuclease UvrABC nuclease subunit